MTTHKPNSTESTTAHTFIGFSEYHGQTHLYDGCFDEQSVGSVEQVIAYLEQTKAQIPAGEDTLNWQGANGTWYSGGDARKTIEEEIAMLCDGSHPCFRSDDE